ncbi:hypothetical protein Tco_0658949 [Tanacetum coccineum]
MAYSEPLDTAYQPSDTITLISGEKIEEIMADIQTKTTMEEFTTNDKANYYSGITSIMVNGKRAYELKGKFLDDLRDNAFSRTNGEDTVDLTKQFFGKYYPPSRTGRITITNAIKDPSNFTFKKWLALKFANHMIMDPFTKKVLWDFWNMSNNYEGVADEEISDVKKANNDDEQETAKIFRIETNLFDYKTPLCIKFIEFNFLFKVDPKLFTHDIKRTKTYEEYENKLNDELEEPWSEDGVPYEICDHICEPFCFKNGKAKWSTCNSNEYEFFNDKELPGMVRVGYMIYL